MNIFLLFQAIGLIINTGILVFIYLKLLDTKVGRAFYLIMISVSIWIFGEVMMYSSENPVVALEWTKFSNFGASFIGPTLIWFVLVITNQDHTIKKSHIALLVLISSFFSVFSLKTDLVFSDLVKTYWGYRTVNSILYFPLGVYVATCALIAIYMAFVSLSSMSQLQRKQLSLFFLAFLIPLVGGIGSEIIAPLFNLNIPPLTSVLFSYTGLIIAYAIIKYQFLSITPSLALQTVFDTMKDIVIAIDINGLIKLVNRAVTIALGYERNEIINKPISIILGPDFSIDKIKQLLEGSPDGFATTIFDKNNIRKIPVLVTGNIILSPANIEQGIVIITHDKTHTNELTSNLEQKTIELETSRFELEKNIAEVKKLNSFMVDREIKMADLKKQLNKCKKQK